MNIYYKQIGKGEPIILLHGNQEDHHIYDTLIQDLTDYKCILVDSRYHGQSVKKGPLTLQQLSQDIKAIVDELSIDTYTVIGFSDGANIAIQLAQIDTRLKRMILLSPNSDVKTIKLYYRLSLYLQLLCLLPFMIYNTKARLLFKLIRFMLKEPHFTYQQLSSIDIPVLLLSGEYDMIQEQDFIYLNETLQNCTYIQIKNSSHFTLKDQYIQTKDNIRRFLYETNTYN